MKKVLSVFTSVIMILCGCSGGKTIVGSGASETAEQSSEDYTADDLIVLQDFLLGKRTDSNGKNFDLNNDGEWDVFDFCLLRDKISPYIPENSSDILVTYFSCTGTTETIAKYMADYLNADTYAIIPEEPYTEDDLKYYTDCRADREQSDPSARPAISGAVENMDDYETVFIGYPIWHGQAPRIISTFLESYDFSGKTVIPFCTSASSGIGSSDTNLHSLAENADWIAGKRFSSGTSEKDVADWIDTLPISEKRDEIKLNIEVNGHLLTATLEDNSSAEAFAELLKSEPLTIEMSDYANFEKVGSLGTSLPRNDEKITTEAGDLILYQGNQITIYYDENTWNFTRLGKIDNITQAELKDILGTGSVTVTFSLEKKTGVFDMERKTILLNSGYEMPINGLGTYSLHDDKCVNAVKSAIKSGVRLIDTASVYGNEEEVGQAIRESIEELGIRREDIFVTTKIYPGSEMANPEESIQACLDRLNIGYVDMMLLHHPDTNDVKAYKAMEKFVEDGKIRSIGLSNWYIDELEEFLPQINITPALVQNEIHPYYQENDVIPYIQNLGIVVQGWYPLGGRGHTAELLGDEVISAIAESHNVSSAQVILRWNLQKGVVVIPGSSNPNHIRENTELFGFELTDDEMNSINALDRNEKHDWY
ncbi:MAG: cyclophilin-like fold protein [Ruminococcus flavefaciens]|nr:cyclophilin-like fold protein [Ruminococcus flavefaciens]MCM1230583.1 cyclophilin-like fold protein [Ruminococcus flavefaciens]